MKPKFGEHKQIILTGTKNSTVKEIAICIADPEWSFEKGKVIYSFVDGKFCSPIDYNKFRNHIEFSSDEICIRSGGSGTAVVLVKELISAIETLRKNRNDFLPTPDDDKSLDGQMLRIRKGIEYAVLRGNRLRENAKKKTNSTEHNIFIRNLRDVKVIEAALKKVFTTHREDYVKNYKKFYISKVESFEKDLKNGHGRSIADILYHGRFGEEKYNFAKKYFTEKRNHDFKYEISRVKNWKKLCELTARTDVAEMEKGFMDKNIFKIGTIVHNKDNFKSVKVMSVQTGPFGFEGQFLIRFKDGSEFLVLSQAVYAEGPIVTGHYRYPTTFHNVKYPTGKFSKKQSEEEMINKFSKTK